MADNLVEVDEFTEFVQVPEDGDDRDAASVVQGFQPLANRTLNLRNLLTALPTTEHAWTAKQSFTTLLALGDVQMVGEVKYSDAAGAAVKKSRDVQLPLTSFAAGSSAWTFQHKVLGNYTYRGWNKLADASGAGYLVGEFQIPNNAIFVKARACVTVSADATLTMSVGRVATLLLAGDLNGSAVEEPATPVNISNVSAQIISLNHSSAGEHASWGMDAFVSFLVTDAGTATVHWVKATFMDPGARNY